MSCEFGVDYYDNDVKWQAGVIDIKSCQRFCTDEPNSAPYFLFLEGEPGHNCWCKTKLDPAMQRSGRYLSGPVFCLIPGMLLNLCNW